MQILNHKIAALNTRDWEKPWKVEKNNIFIARVFRLLRSNSFLSFFWEIYFFGSATRDRLMTPMSGHCSLFSIHTSELIDDLSKPRRHRHQWRRWRNRWREREKRVWVFFARLNICIFVLAFFFVFNIGYVPPSYIQKVSDTPKKSSKVTFSLSNWLLLLLDVCDVMLDADVMIFWININDLMIKFCYSNIYEIWVWSKKVSL